MTLLCLAGSLRAVAFSVETVADGLAEGRLFGLTIGERFAADDPRAKGEPSVCWSSAFGQMSTNVVFREINTNALEVGTVFGRAYVLADRRTERIVGLCGGYRLIPNVSDLCFVTAADKPGKTRVVLMQGNMLMDCNVQAEAEEAAKLAGELLQQYLRRSDNAFPKAFDVSVRQDERKTADGAYRREADAFLSARDTSVQPRQIAAIVKATAGKSDDLEAVRKARNVMAPLPEGVEAETVRPGLRLYRPKGGKDLPLLIYLHGGGWVIGSIASCSAFCGEVASKGVAVLALDYSLAPEDPYPAALWDVWQAVQNARHDPERFGCDPKRISLGGDSSGGNLAIAAAFTLQGERFVPQAIVAYYPVVEARADGTESWTAYATGCGMDAAFMDACNTAYRNGLPYDDPLISPLYASDEQLRRLPPVHVLGADRDVLRDQGVKFVNRLRALGVPVRYELPVGSTHLFVTVPGQPTAFRRAVDFAVEALAR